MAKPSDSTVNNPPDSTSAKTIGGSSQSKADDARATFAPSSDSSSPAPDSSKARHNVVERKGQFLIAPRKSAGMQLMGIQPLNFSVVEQTLRASPDIEIVDTIGPKDNLGALSDGMSGDVPGVLIARMTQQKAGILQQQAQGRLIVERDQPLNLQDVTFQLPPMVTSSISHTGPALKTTITVLGKDNAPVKEAEVYLFGSLLPVTGQTDERGQVTLSLYGETTQSLRGLYVKPKADYWSFYQSQPDISADEPNVVGLRPISDWSTLADFPAKQAFGWGQKAMRLDQLPSNYRGQGIKIAIIDSGAANTHQDLNKIRLGFDIINKKTNPNTWNEDVIAHGSHCAGVIAGADTPGGVRGFAPDAEIHVCKLFPGGQVSQLIDALEYCIEKQVDVVNLSLGGAEPSEALEQQILRAKRAGIACIVAAGNSGGRVQYPASSPNVLAVAAIGQINEFPSDSYHAQTLTPVVDQNGFFSAKFSCFGPEIAVCAPGVAITSSVPPNNYAVWDGTSMAAPHVTGLAALVLAHHPDFQGPFKGKTAERVERLFQLIKYSTRPVNLGDPARTGFGMPDVLIALGLQPSIHMQSNALGAALPQGMLQGILGSLVNGVAGSGPVSSALNGQNQGRAMGNSYPFQADRGQFMPQAFGGASGMPAIDPATYAYLQPFLAQEQIRRMQGMAYGIPPGMRGQAW